jgi:thiamine biosynthesis protein ThiS
MVRVILNGEARAIEGALDVAGLLATLSLDARKVAVERNLAIVPRSAYAATSLQDGDRIEIVQFIGGG